MNLNDVMFFDELFGEKHGFKKMLHYGKLSFFLEIMSVKMLQSFHEYSKRME